MGNIKQLQKAITIATKAGMALLKSHVKAYTRITASGQQVQVAEHDDNRQSGLDHSQAKKAVKDTLKEHKNKGYKIIDEHHTDDGISVDRDKAEHSHYFMEDEKGNKATIYSHRDKNGSNTVGASKDGSVPKHTTATKYLQMPEEWKNDK